MNPDQGLNIMLLKDTKGSCCSTMRVYFCTSKTAVVVLYYCNLAGERWGCKKSQSVIINASVFTK